jgi:hypothetical protein
MTVIEVQLSEVYVHGLVEPSWALVGAWEQSVVQGTTLELTVLLLRNSSHLNCPTVMAPNDR